MRVKRLIGQETEYAIGFQPENQGSKQPSNYLIFKEFKHSLAQLVRLCPGYKTLIHEFFIENGGAFSYEFLPWALHDGLLEGKTPECSSASELLLYQRAQESLLLKALPQVQRNLRARGYRGEIFLLKNCRDAAGHLYGTQENYETTIATGPRLWLLRLGLLAFFPLLALTTGLWLALLVLMLGLFLLGVSLFTLASWTTPLAPPAWRAPLEKFVGKSSPLRTDDFWEKQLIKWEYLLFSPILITGMYPYVSLWQLTAFSKQRKLLCAFFASRPIISGAGCLTGDGTFHLSEKATGLKSLMRNHSLPTSRCLFDTGNLLKNVMFTCLFPVAGTSFRYKNLFQSTQRLQIGMADANRCQYAEYLKFAITRLVLEMCENNWLEDAPQPLSPVAAIRQLNSDSSLSLRIPLKGRKPACNALELQAYYLQKAKTYLEQAPYVSLDSQKVVEHWEQTLQALGSHPEALIGRIDWITKRHFLDTSGTGLSYLERKKIDLSYHQLNGYFQELEKANIAISLLPPEAIAKAETQASSPEQAQARARLIGLSYDEGKSMYLSWDSSLSPPPQKLGKVLAFKKDKKKPVPKPK